MLAILSCSAENNVKSTCLVTPAFQQVCNADLSGGDTTSKPRQQQWHCWNALKRSTYDISMPLYGKKFACSRTLRIYIEIPHCYALSYGLHWCLLIKPRMYQHLYPALHHTLSDPQALLNSDPSKYNKDMHQDFSLLYMQSSFFFSRQQRF